MNKIIKFKSAGDDMYVCLHHIVSIDDQKAFMTITMSTGDRHSVFKDKNPDFLDRLLQAMYTV